VIGLIRRHNVKRREEASQKKVFKKTGLLEKRICMKITVTKENIQNCTTKHETSRPKSEKQNEQDDAECIFCKETFLISTSDKR
jgi:hypothetical protein